MIDFLRRLINVFRQTETVDLPGVKIVFHYNTETVYFHADGIKDDEIADLVAHYKRQGFFFEPIIIDPDIHRRH